MSHTTKAVVHSQCCRLMSGSLLHVRVGCFPLGDVEHFRIPFPVLADESCEVAGIDEIETGKGEA